MLFGGFGIGSVGIGDGVEKDRNKVGGFVAQRLSFSHFYLWNSKPAANFRNMGFFCPCFYGTFEDKITSVLVFFVDVSQLSDS